MAVFSAFTAFQNLLIFMSFDSGIAKAKSENLVICGSASGCNGRTSFTLPPYQSGDYVENLLTLAFQRHRPNG